jgi:hypothetical protein
MICIAAGVIPTVAKRRHLALIALMLIATAAGATVGRIIWERQHPDFPSVLFCKGSGGELGRHRWEYMGWCSIPGAILVPLAAAAFAAVRNRSD